MLQKTPKASKGDWVGEIYFYNDFGITKKLQNVVSYVFEKCLWNNNIEIWKQITIQFAEW